MKREAANWIEPGAVVFVSDNWVAGLGEMNADLMFPACLEPHLYNRCFRTTFQYVHVSYSRFSDFPVRSRVDSIRRVFRQVRSNRKVIRDYASFDHCRVSPARSVFLKLILQPFLRLSGFGESQESRRFAVQPMNDEKLFWTLLTIQVGTQGSVRGFGFFRVRGHCQ
jgi:hypothetical protein